MRGVFLGEHLTKERDHESVWVFASLDPMGLTGMQIIWR